MRKRIGNGHIPSMSEFVESLDLECRTMHPEAYLRSSLYRQYRSLLMVLKWVGEGERVLSIGAGGAFVEEYLAAARGARVYIADFAEAIEINRSLYAKWFEGTFAGDIASPDWLPPVTDVDQAFWFDNIEHLAADPVTVLQNIKQCMSTNGKLFITTDNFARVGNLIKLMLRKPLMPSPDRFFAPVSFENEGIHRREYTLPELKEILDRAGYRLEEVEHIWQSRRVRPARVPVRLAEWMLPIYRPHFLLRAGIKP